MKNAFAGIRVCVCVLIFNAVCKLWKGSGEKQAGACDFMVVTLGSLFLDLSPILFVVVATVLGIGLEQFKPSSRKKEGEA